MKIQFRVLKHIGGDVFLVHIATPLEEGKENPNGDSWIHLGVITMDKTSIEKMSAGNFSIIWTSDIHAPRIGE